MQKQGRAHHLVVPRTLLFLERGGRWLFLEGGETKWFAGCLNGLGGGVEPGEDVLSAAFREAEEECGLRPETLEVCGTVHVAADPVVMMFVLRGTLPEGDLKTSEEGTLHWIEAADVGAPEPPFVDDVEDLFPLVLAGETFHLHRTP
jgi:8-oxo-dGTP diphosphatase